MFANDGSSLRNCKNSLALSPYLTAANSPTIIPAKENIPLKNPFFKPSNAGISTMTMIIISSVFKSFII